VPELFSLAADIPEKEGRFPCPLIRESEAMTQTNTHDEQSCFESLKISNRMPKPHFRNGIIRIQGIEPNPDLPMDWIAQNLQGPDHFLHACVLILGVSQAKESE
jgi:hypothetical protein